MSAEWTYLLGDLRGNNITAEVELTGVSLSKLLNDTGQLTATLPLARNRNIDPQLFATPGRTALYALRDGVPWWGGIIWTSRQRGSAGAVTLGGADWWSYYDRRDLVGLSTIDGMVDMGSGAPYVIAGDANDVIVNLMSSSDLGGWPDDVAFVEGPGGYTYFDSPGNIWVLSAFDFGSPTPRSGLTISRSYYNSQLPKIGDELRAITKLDGGPDLVFDTIPDPFGTTAPRRVVLFGSPRLGDQSRAHVFELGGNVIDYEWSIDASTMATRAYAVGDGIAAGAPIAVHQDSTLHAAGWPLLETDSSYMNEINTANLIAHARSDQAARGRPQVTPSVTLDGARAPKFGEYKVGDTGQLLIKDLYFPAGLDVTVRIVGITVQPSEAVEQVTLALNLVPEEE